MVASYFFVDGFYTPINLMIELDKISLYVTVTIAKNRLLEEIKTNKTKNKYM